MSDWFYALGVDATHGGIGRTSRSKKKNDADDFAAAVWRGRRGGGPAELVHAIRIGGLTDNQMSGIVHLLHAKFAFDIVILDPGGGGLFVRDKLREPMQDMGNGQFPVIPIITEDDDQMRGVGQAIMVLFSRSDSRLKRLGLLMPCESFLPNKAHELLRGAFENGNVSLPPIWDGWDQTSIMFSHADQMRAYLNDLHGLQGRAKAQAEIDLALSQLVQVERKLSKDLKTPEIDKHGMFNFVSTAKKDSAYAVLYGYFGLWLLREEISAANRSDSGDFIVMIDG